MIILGNILKEIRSELGITQEQFARELNISFSTLNRWENGHTTPSRLAKTRLFEFCNNQDVSPSTKSKLEKYNK